jgi:hypothetical protein
MIERSRGFIIKKNDGKISRQEFHSQYAKFCTLKHYSVNSPGTVTRQVEKLGYKPHKSNGIWHWLGLETPKEIVKDENQGSLF